jgi:hypothetical protein
MTIRVKKPVTAGKLAKAEKTLANRKGKRKGFDAKKYLGKLKGVFGDPVEYQRKIRNEWD